MYRLLRRTARGFFGLAGLWMWLLAAGFLAVDALRPASAGPFPELLAVQAAGLFAAGAALLLASALSGAGRRAP